MRFEMLVLETKLLIWDVPFQKKRAGYNMRLYNNLMAFIMFNAVMMTTMMFFYHEMLFIIIDWRNRKASLVLTFTMLCFIFL